MDEPITLSDTALWAAVYRARESAHSQPLFQDPFARALAGARGEEIGRSSLRSDNFSWVVPIRTYLLDRLIEKTVAARIPVVLNLAAGLDTRPYRLSLPRSLHWIEVDKPGLLEYKESVLGQAEPACSLRRIGLDLFDRKARGKLFREIALEVASALVITEGLLIYMTELEVGSLASELLAARVFRRWILDLQSPALLRAIQRNPELPFGDSGPSLQFAPQEGPDFFMRCGWQVTETYSMLRAAADAARVPAHWVRVSGDTGAGLGGRRIDGFVCSLSPA
jgi:methyltransferase (TIGR00027 family)